MVNLDRQWKDLRNTTINTSKVESLLSFLIEVKSTKNANYTETFPTLIILWLIYLLDHIVVGVFEGFLVQLILVKTKSGINWVLRYCMAYYIRKTF